MTSEGLLSMSIKVLYVPNNFYTYPNKFLAMPWNQPTNTTVHNTSWQRQKFKTQSGIEKLLTD